MTVVPPEAHSARANLWSALGAASGVRIEPGWEGALGDAEGSVVFGADPPPDSSRAKRARVMVVPPARRTSHENGMVRFSCSELLDPVLRGRRMEELRIPAPLRSVPPGFDVLARTAGGRPLWAGRVERGRRTDLVSAAPGEISGGEGLRDRLTEGRFARMLPFHHSLRHLAGPEAWRPPPVRACFLFDDPNLHSISYGYVRYASLARSARRTGYHAAMATIPLDCWAASPAAVEVFRREPGLSLILHGNDHLRGDLACRTADEARALLRQALGRIRAFERRTGLRVERLISPPHGVCSGAAMAEAVAVGLEAICVSSPRPWPGSAPSSPLERWGPADLGPSGLPVIPRSSVRRPMDDFVFRAMLGQPLVFSCHHWDLERGCGVLEERASEVASLGEVGWRSPGVIARSNLEVRPEGSTLAVRLFARRVRLRVPDGMEALRVELPSWAGLDPAPRVVCVASGSVEARDHLPATFGVRGPRDVDIQLVRPGPPPPEAVPPGRGPWPLVRRFLTEARDRLMPYLPGIGPSDSCGWPPRKPIAPPAGGRYPFRTPDGPTRYRTRTRGGLR